MVNPRRRRFNVLQRQKRRAKRKIVIKYLRGHCVGKGTAAELTDSFNDLKKIVKEGCKRLENTNGAAWVNAYIKSARLGTGNVHYFEASRLPQTEGDKYALEMLTRIKRMPLEKEKPLRPEQTVSVEYAYPGQIKRIYIVINPKLPRQEREKRKEFYRKELPKRLIEFIPGIPLKAKTGK